MNMNDLIMDSGHTPTIIEAGSYIGGSAGELWWELNQYIKNTYRISPKAAYSACSGQPGWNFKYRKSDKALCTLYPEKDRFIVLVVVTLAFIESLHESGYANPFIWDIIEAARSFNKTKWLMIPVENRAAMESILELISLKLKQ